MINFVYILFILLIYGDYCFTETNGKSCNKRLIGVVDGGSTSTRLHIFEFNFNNLKKLKKEYRFKSKTPISTFSQERSNWGLMKIMLEEFILNAKTVVPNECIAVTPIYIQLTAGVRQLGEIASKRILKYIREFLLKSTFKFQNSFVDLLSLKNEGITAWISVNYLLKRLGTNKTTFGLLDLGGGSTQIAVESRNTKLLSNAVQMNLFGKKYKIYSAGFNFFGINEIRAKYLNATVCANSCCRNQILKSACINETVSTRFEFRNCNLQIGGKPVKDFPHNDRFGFCSVAAAFFVSDLPEYTPELKNMEFVAISAYYFIITAGLGISEKGKDLIETSFSNLFNPAVRACDHPKSQSKTNRFQHFLCLDLAYIICLFNHVYGLKWDDKIFVSEMIDGINVSWALGYAISTL